MKYKTLIAFLIVSFSLFPTGAGAQQASPQPPPKEGGKGVSPITSPLGGGREGATYAVVVGISDYQDEGIPDLRFADKDALAFAGFLQSPAGGSLDEDHLKVLINEKATVAQFAIALDWLWEVVKENDRVIIYFSGHGDVERKSITQPGYLLCWDAPARVYMAGGAFNVRDLNDVVSTLSLQNKAKVILVTDACRAGKLSGSGIGGSQATAANLSRQFANEIKILSCQPDEYSIEGEQWGGGRGAFSYHLLNGLTGMADEDADMAVNLKEIGRYLEDYVTQEVAPQNQNPMVVGNKTEKLTDVFPEILAQLRDGKKGQLQLFTATETKGIEEEVLAAADSNIVVMYFAFQNALSDKQFLFAEKGRAENDYADFYYKKLSKEPQLEKLHSSIRHNYAAALQDDAQQTMNDWMKTSEDHLLKAGSGNKESRLPEKVFTEKVKSFPVCLERAAELLGKDHYMYPTLQARKHFFKGYLLTNTDRNPNTELGREALAEFHQALRWQPDLPQAYWQMISVYGLNLLQPDSAEVCGEKAVALNPSWVLPYTKLAFLFCLRYKQFDKAKVYLEKAIQIDSNACMVINNWGVYYLVQKEFDKAEKYFKNAIQLDSTFTMAYGNLGVVYYEQGIQQYDQAEKYFKKTIQLDSTYLGAYANLGLIYGKTRQYGQAEKYLLKAIQLDSTQVNALNSLGGIYKETHRDEKAEKYFIKIIQLDSTFWAAYANLVNIYQNQQRWKASMEMATKLIKFGPPLGTFVGMIGNVYTHMPGHQEKAKAKLDQALGMSPNSPDVHIYMAQWYLKNNQPDLAWKYFEEGLEKGIGYEGLSKYYLDNCPDFEGMRKDPKWNALMKKYFPEEYKN